MPTHGRRRDSTQTLFIRWYGGAVPRRRFGGQTDKVYMHSTVGRPAEACRRLPLWYSNVIAGAAWRDYFNVRGRDNWA